MAREIVAWCDVDMRTDERVPAITYALDLGRGPREIDLCESHAKALLAPLVEVVEALGGKPSKPSKASPPIARQTAGSGSLDELLLSERRGRTPAGERDHPCPWCPLNYANATGLLGHIRKAHGFTSDASAADVFGAQCPLCGQAYGSLGNHASKSHDIPGVAALFAAAREAGDPYGVVAERTALASQVRS